MSSPLPAGATCDHQNMSECHESCGHFYCDDCGLSWDEFGEGWCFPEEDPPQEDPEQGE